MKGSRGLFELPARLVVGSVRTLSRHRLTVSCLGLVLTVLIAGGYILISALQVNPARSTYAVRVLLPSSGGLLPNQDVTLRGVSIGRVASVRPSGDGVEAVATINADVHIPQDTTVRVSGMSAAGEQYLDFRPQANRGPMLTNGSTIGERQAAVPVSLARLLQDASGVLAQADPGKIATIFDELRVSPRGPQKLAALLDGGSLLINTLDSVLPQTISVMRNSRFVLATFADSTPGLAQTTQNLQNILPGVNAMDGGFRTLVDRGGSTLTALDDVIADNSETMVQLLGNLTTIAQLSYVRVPALKALFPTYRGSTIDAVSSAVHDGGLWFVFEFYSHYACDYNLPRRAPAIPDFHEPYLYTYCENPDPSVLIRGARNAPRPPGDDTAGPPPGYDPLKTSDPTPTGEYSIPTTYGGPPMPQNPPN